MLPNFLIPEATYTKEGVGEPIALGESKGKLLRLTLGITRIVEQQSLDIAIYGSVDGLTWNPKPLSSFTQKFYCGTYVVVVDLQRNPAVEYVRVQWKMNRWGRGNLTPMFDFYIFAQEAVVEAAMATA